MSSEKAVAALLGKTHAPKVPAMTPATREWITGILDEEYNRGHYAGVRSVERSAIWREVGCFVAGALLAGIAVMRILA